jgi:hypothetical protein
MVNDNDRELMETPAFREAMQQHHATQIIPPEMTTLEAWTPRLRVKYVGWTGELHQETVTNAAAEELEDEGHTVIGFQFETWVQHNDIQSCCWITYSLADDDATTDDGGNNGNT